MKKFIITIFIVLCFYGISFSTNSYSALGPFMHDGSNFSYFKPTYVGVGNGGYSNVIGFIEDVFMSSSDANTPRGANTTSRDSSIYRNPPHDEGSFYPKYIKYEDEILKKLIPYLCYGVVQSGIWDTPWLSAIRDEYKWGASYPDWFDSYYYKDDVRTKISPAEAYELGVFSDPLNSIQGGIIRAYTWIGEETILNSTFGYTKAPIEMYVSSEDLSGAYAQQYIDDYNTYIPDNPNVIWAMFAKVKLKETIDKINDKSLEKGEGYRIEVMHYVEHEPIWTFLD
ncbi:MAG: hypothetical protein ABUK08_00120 [Candidatus Humimicrobiaceae bacterium]